ncbi:MAG: imidazole glycerol phosphate synthase subunit HisH [Burkholderiales bacterium]|nr:imidazole glycerol phosphate synthase subunit HisH [Burkholderiales bacterium]
MIKIVDYGLGNVCAFSNMYRRLNIPVVGARCAAELEGATKIVLPGVGAFDRAMEMLDASGMRSALERLVMNHKVPVLGVCVGMQILAKNSDEGRRQGLGWVSGSVRAFKMEKMSAHLPLPHMGWNDVTPLAGSGLFNGLEGDARFYFLHSYYFECEQQESVAARCSYGIDFSCAVRSGNVYGVQFHPEKSHHYGALLLKNFADL